MARKTKQAKVDESPLREWARNNYGVDNPILEIWHPVIQDECRSLNKAYHDKLAAEEADRKARERKHIGEVVESVANINADLAGRIVVRVKFEGSLPKTKRLTKEEKVVVMSVPDEVRVLIGADKPLFTSEEYDDLVSFINRRRTEFANMGIPHIQFKAAHVVDITRIPEIEALAEKTEVELKALADKLVAVYPQQITPEATKLGPLYNPRDYVSVEGLSKMFTFDYCWMAFGVPEELHQFNPEIYKKAKAKAEAVWKEIEHNGIVLLRSTMSELITGLVESLTNREDGTKRKFYASSVTKVQDFIAGFKARNICNDAELDAEVEKIGKLVANVDLKAMSTDMELRASMKRQLEKAKEGVDQLLVDAGARVIELED